ncbi:MAG: DUF6894 family protein [Caulobacteraceae bacterium]
MGDGIVGSTESGVTDVGRYFFDLIDSDKIVEDPEGTLCPDIDSACREAVAVAGDQLCDDVKSGRLVDRRYYPVRDEAGREVYRTLMIAALGPSV